MLPFEMGVFLLGMGIIVLLTQYYFCKREEMRLILSEMKPKSPFSNISKVDYVKAIKRKTKIPFAIRKRTEWRLRSLGDWFVSSWSDHLSKIRELVPQKRNVLKRSSSFNLNKRIKGRNRAANRILKRTLFFVTAASCGLAFCQPVSRTNSDQIQESSPRETDVLSHLVTHSTLVMTASDREGANVDRWWDSDSEMVGVDDRCSACISDHEEDFIPGSLVPVNRTIKGFAGSRTSEGIMMGILRWKIQDNQGVEHTWEIPGSYYVPGAGMRLFSPQHWSQTRPEYDQVRNKWAKHSVSRDQAVLKWNQRQDALDLTYDKRSNVFNFYLAPGYKQFEAFVTEADLQDDNDPVVFDTYVTDDEDNGQDDASTASDESLPQAPSAHAEGVSNVESTPFEDDPNAPVLIDILPEDGQTSERVIDQDEEDKPVENKTAELLRTHHRLNHLPFSKIKLMAENGFLPSRLANVTPPVCSACLYGKATRRPWRSKPRKDAKVRKATQVGQIVSVDMLRSPIPGLIAQMSGWITGKRYWYATVYVDHKSRYSYVHLQKTQSAQETIEGKRLFENMAARHGIRILHYHADNGIFVSKAWKDDCDSQRQGMSYSGVNAHFQSGIAERRIRELQDNARVLLIHAQRRWPSAVTANLWPYAIRTSNESFNEAPLKQLSGKTPIEIFTHGQVMPEPKHSRPFACPVYVLDNALQQSKPHRKWDERSRVGLYLGRSPFHARSVALVLNLTTARVSPQYHVQFDPSFQTIRESFGGIEPPSHWQSICGFTKSRKTPKSDQSQDHESARPDPHVLQELRNADARNFLNPVPSENSIAHPDAHSEANQAPHIFHQNQEIQNVVQADQQLDDSMQDGNGNRSDPTGGVWIQDDSGNGESNNRQRTTE